MGSRSLYFILKRRHKRDKLAHRGVIYSLSRGSIAFGMGFSLLLVLGLLVGVGYYASLTTDLPSLEQLSILLDPENGILLQPTTFYDRSGEQRLFTLENPGIPRRYLPVSPEKPNRISPRLVQVTVALTEPNFWESPGFRWDALTSLKAETIAEKLIGDLLLWKEEDGLRKSLRVRLLAAQMIADYGRTQTLEWYLNSAYYGHLAYGAESAAQLYLGKSARDLNLAESALLFAASQTPALNPLDAPEAAIDRQREVLASLLENNAITEQEYQDALDASLTLQKPLPVNSTPLQAFFEAALEELETYIDIQHLGRGGWRILTTIDSDLQTQLECAARLQLSRLEGRSQTPDENQETCEAGRLLPTLAGSSAALPAGLAVSGVLLDPTSGEVLAMLGDTTLDSALQTPVIHQPGSILTPFVAATAFSRGFSPASLVWDIPANRPDNMDQIQNPDGAFHGPVRLRIALANDYLIPIAYIMDQFGASDMLRMMRPFGLTDLEADKTPTELLFSGGAITDLELAWAYSIFANQGLQRGISKEVALNGENAVSLQPTTILRVESLQGEAWLEDIPIQEQFILSPQLAYLVNDVFSDEIARRPSLGYPSPLSIARPAAAKVGRVAGNRQIWAAGYTPGMVSVIWMGLPASEIESDQSLELNERMVIGLWHAVMQYATRNQPVSDWEQPTGITQMDVCDPSGQIPTRQCPMVVNEVFLEGNEPVLYDTLFRVFSINRETGKLATVFTPLHLVDERIYMVVPPEAVEWAKEAGLPLPPSDYDVIQSPPKTPGVVISSPGFYQVVGGEVNIEGSARGDGFLSYRLQVGEGLNPQSWLQIGEESTTPIENGSLGKWDTQGLDGLYAIRLTVEFEGRRIVTDITQVTVDNQPPAVNVLYPQANQIFDDPNREQILFQADIADAIGIDRVIWLIDGKEMAVQKQPPYLYHWESTPGEHTLVVQAIDLAGNRAESEAIPFSVTGQ